MLYTADKAGMHPHPQNLLEGFRKAIKDYGLDEI